MMAPWQVWSKAEDNELVLVVSSEFHLRANVGRITTVLPLIETYMPLDYRVHVEHPGDVTDWYVVTDQIHTTSAQLKPTGWTLTEPEIDAVRQALKHMVAFG
jgi:hypothetical protein